MTVSLSNINLGSHLDPWPKNIYVLPTFFNESSYIDLVQILNHCRMADNATLLKNADGNWAKAYRFWMYAPSTWDDWGQLNLEAPQEIETVGRYIITYERLKINNDHPTPEWIVSQKQLNMKKFFVFLTGFILGILSLFLLIYHNKLKF